MVQENITQKEQIIELLNKSLSENKISNWNVNSYQKERSNIYLNKESGIESILDSKRVEYEINIYKEYEDEIGESSFTINESDSIEKIKEEIEDAIFISSQSKSKKYKLPKADDEIVQDKEIDYSHLYNSKFFTEFKDKNINIFVAQKIDEAKKLIKEKSDENIELVLNYLDFFNTINQSSFTSSSGIEKSQKKNGSYFEFCITAKDKNTNKESEHIVYHDIDDMYDFDYEKFFKEIIEYAKDSTKAENAKDYSGKVILKDKACIDFWNPDLTMNSIIGHASARLKFFNMSKFEKEEPISDTKNDKLTIYSNPELKNSSSLAYDGLGISAKKLCIIENNIFKNHFASKQYADYLGIEPTGPFGPIEIETGDKTLNDLYKDDDEVIEIISFSSFVPDLSSGDFSAEIRLAYKIKNGKKTPIKGGLFNGNIFKIIEEMHLSKEKVNAVGYVGPKAVKFNKAEIVGL